MATALFFLMAAVFAEQTVAPVRGELSAEFAWWRIDAERVVASKWYRLMTEAGAEVWINGVRLNAAGPGVFDVTSLRRRNVVVTRPAQPVRLSITPRVFIDGTRIERTGDEIRLRITVRNTLENTVNAAVAARANGAVADVPATVPPGVSQDVTIRLAARSFGNESVLTLALDKEEEAMEAGYRFETEVRLAP